MRSFCGVFARVSLVFLIACRGADRPSGDVTVSDSAGVPILTSSRAGLDRPLARTLADEPHLRLGSLADGEETQFTNLLDAQRLSDGSLLVAESGDMRVRLFDAEGGFLRWIGSVGEGPAEYSNVLEVGVLEGDTIWVHDRIRRGLVLFLPDGSFVRSFQPERPVGAPRPVRGRMISDGTVVDQGSTLDFSDIPEGASEAEEDVVISVMDREGGGAMSIADAPGSAYKITSEQFPDGRWMTVMGPESRFESLTLFAFGADRIFRADPAAFEIREIALTGDVVGITRVRRPRIPFTDPMISEYQAAVLEDLRSRDVALTSPSFENVVYADSLPHFGSVLADGGRHLWLAEFVEHHYVSARDARRWWRVGGEGGIEGYLDLPEDFRLLRIQGDEVWGSVRDELDVPYLVAYRLVEP